MVGTSRISSASPANNPPSLKKSTSGSQSNMSQKSIASFFQKRNVEGSAAKVNVPSKLPNPTQAVNGTKQRGLPFNPARGSSQSLTPAPSSDAIEEDDMEDVFQELVNGTGGANTLPSPITPASGTLAEERPSTVNNSSVDINSPSRKVGIQSSLRLCCSF